MSTPNLTASFVLKLEDMLSKGILALTKRLEKLAALGKKLSLSGLDGVDRVLDRMGASADAAGRKVDGIAGAARRAARELGALSKPIYVNAAGAAFVPPSLRRVMNAGMAAAVAASVVAATASMPVPRLAAPGRPAPGASQLLLGAPGGIPLAPLNPAFLHPAMTANWAGAFSTLSSSAAGFRAQLAGIATQAKHVTAEMQHLGHAAIGAFAAGFGLMHPIHEYAAYENTLRHIAITANVPREGIPNAVAGLSRQYNGLALGTGQSSERIAEAANFLITTGIGKHAVDTMLPHVARAATAYNTNIGDSVQAIFSLKENLHVADDDMAGTVSAMALAGKEGHFSFSDMSRFLPEIAPLAALSGLKGAAGSRELFAMLETSRRNAGTSGEAATNVRDYLSHLFGDSKRGLGHEFAKHGVDLNAMLLRAEKGGISAPEAVLGQVMKMTAGKTDYQKNLIIGSLFHNIQSASFVRGALNDLPYMREVLAKLQHADAGTIDADFLKAFDAPKVQLDLLMEKLTQVQRRFGEAFSPVILKPMNRALDWTLRQMEWLDALNGRRTTAHRSAQDMDGAGGNWLNGPLGLLGGGVATATALGLLVPVLRLMLAGVKLLVSPVTLLWAGLRLLATGAGVAVGALQVLGVGAGVAAGLVVASVAAIAGAAYLIYENWGAVGPWLMKLWDDAAGYLRSFYEVFAGLFTGDKMRVGDGLILMKDSVIGFFKTLWAGVEATFNAFVDWAATTWPGQAAAQVADGIKSAWGGLTGIFSDIVAGWRKPFDDFFGAIEQRIRDIRNSPVGRALGLADPDPNRPPTADEQGLPQRLGAERQEGSLDIGIRVFQDGRPPAVEAVPNTQGINLRPIVIDSGRGPMTNRN